METSASLLQPFRLFMLEALRYSQAFKSISSARFIVLLLILFSSNQGQDVSWLLTRVCIHIGVILITSLHSSALTATTHVPGQGGTPYAIIKHKIVRPLSLLSSSPQHEYQPCLLSEHIIVCPVTQ